MLYYIFQTFTCHEVHKLNFKLCCKLTIILSFCTGLWRQRLLKAINIIT
jgi:hypothetical protein